MNKMLYKELKLAASPLAYIFLVSAFLTFVPNYPILLGVFFTTMGIFQSFQLVPQNNDIGYSLLLPVAKADIVRGKYAATLLVELIGFVIMLVCTLIRMCFLSGSAVYLKNPLMGANIAFLGLALLGFGLFNAVFLRGFFKTAYSAGKPFLIYCAAACAYIALAEALHYFPGLERINSLGFENMGLQLAVLCVGALGFTLLTLLSYRGSVKCFEKLDL